LRNNQFRQVVAHEGRLLDSYETKEFHLQNPPKIKTNQSIVQAEQQKDYQEKL
jgi:hypothetical protein